MLTSLLEEHPPTVSRMSESETVANRTPDELEMVRAILRSLSAEVLVLVTPKGEVVTTGTNSFVFEASDIEAFVHPDDLVAALAFLRRVSRGRVQPTIGVRLDAGSDITIDLGGDSDLPFRPRPFRPERLRIRVRKQDETWEPVEAEVVDPKNHPLLPGVVLRVRPIFVGEIDHADAHERFQSLAELLPLGILSADRRGEVVYGNGRAEKILSRSAAHLMGRGWEEAVHPGDIEGVREASTLAAREGIPQQVVFRVETGLFQRWATASFVPLGVPPDHTGWIATLDDVTERLRAESELSHQATHDALTGLPNRVLLEDRLRQACSRLRRATRSVTVVFVDLDAFKEVNDRFGHAAGDEVLVGVGERLQRVVREVDTVCRYAGDEFVIVCEDLDEGDVVGLEKRIVSAIGEPMELSSGPVQMGASVGSVTTIDPDLDPATLLAEADARMYRVKRSHR